MSKFFLKLAKNFSKLSFALLLICMNCSHPVKRVDTEDNGIKEIDIIANIFDNRTVRLSEIASSIDYCMLETHKKCLVTGINIYCSTEYVVAAGGGTSNPVWYVFDRKSGNFIRQISRYGQGPGEFTEIVRGFWDGYKEQVCVFVNNQYHFYNLTGSLSHHANRFKHYMDHFIAHEDCYVGYVPNRLGSETVRIAFYDKTGVFIDSISNYRTWQRTQTWYSGGNDNWIYVFNNNLYFKELYSDTLYHIKDFTLHPRYVFNTGRRAVPYEIQEGGRYDAMQALRTQGIVEDRYERYIIIVKIFEDNKHLYFSFDYKKNRYPVIYNKTKSKLQIMPPVVIPPKHLRSIKDWRMPLYGFENDLDGGLPFWPQ